MTKLKPNFKRNNLIYLNHIVSYEFYIIVAKIVGNIRINMLIQAYVRKTAGLNLPK